MNRRIILAALAFLVILALAVPYGYAQTSIDHKLTSDNRMVANDFAYDKINLKVITSADTMYQALKSGQLDFMARYISPDQLSDAQSDPNLEVVSSLDFGFYYLAFNLKKADKPFLANRLFRHAIAYLIDRDYIVSNLLQGQGIALATPIPPCYGDFSVQNPDGTLKDVTIIADTDGDGQNETRTPADFERTYTYDPQKAAAILDQLGRTDIDGDGIREYDPNDPESDISAILLTPNYDPIRVSVGDMIQQHAQEIGIEIINNPVDFNTLISQIEIGTDPNTGEPVTGSFDMYILGRGLGLDPDYLPLFFGTDYFAPGGLNFPGFTNSTFDYYAYLTRYETNPVKLKRAFYAAQAILMDALPYVTLYERYFNEVYGHRMHNVAKTILGLSYFRSLLYSYKTDIEGIDVNETELNIGILADIEHRTPLYPSPSVRDSQVLGRIYETMMIRNPAYTLDPDPNKARIPRLIKNYKMEVVDDVDGDGFEDTHFVFVIREGVKRSDGQPVTIDDFVFTYNYLYEHKDVLGQMAMPVTAAIPFNTTEGTVVAMKINDTAFEIYYSGTSPRYLGRVNTYVLPKHIRQNIQDPTQNLDRTLLVGTGPAKFVNFDEDYLPNQQITLHVRHTTSDDPYRALHRDDPESGVTLTFAVHQEGYLTFGNPDTASVTLEDAGYYTYYKGVARARVSTQAPSAGEAAGGAEKGHNRALIGGVIAIVIIILILLRRAFTKKKGAGA